MQLDNVKLRAEPFFLDATCPKGHGRMIQLENGWLSVCWYCETCGYPYELEMRKMRNVDEDGLRMALEKARR